MLGTVFISGALLAACGGDGSSTSAGGASSTSSGTATHGSTTSSATGTTTASSTTASSTGQGGASSCRPVTVGAFQLLDQQAGGSSLAYELNGLGANMQHILYIEFFDVAGPQTAGSFDLSMPPDDDYKTCAHCLLAYEDFGSGTPTAYYPESGLMKVSTPDTAYSGASAGTVDGIRLVEVTLQNSHVTKVPGGKCLDLSGMWSHP